MESQRDVNSGWRWELVPDGRNGPRCTASSGRKQQCHAVAIACTWRRHPRAGGTTADRDRLRGDLGTSGGVADPLRVLRSSSSSTPSARFMPMNSMNAGCFTTAGIWSACLMYLSNLIARYLTGSVAATCHTPMCGTVRSRASCHAHTLPLHT